MKKILYVFRTPRKRIYRQVKFGLMPDHTMYGLNYFDSNKYRVYYTDKGFNRNWVYLFMQLIQKIFIHFISFGFQLDQIIKIMPEINKADVVISTADSAGLPLLFLKKLKIINRKIIYISTGLINELDVRNNLVSIFCKGLFRYADLIVTHSLVEKGKMLKHNKNVFFIPFGVDAKFFTEKRDIMRVGSVLAIGQDRSRDYQLLADVTKIMPNNRFQIVTHLDNVKGIIFMDNVYCMFDIRYKKVREVYQQANVVFLPLREMNRAAGQISFLEALASERIVVCSKIKGLSEVYPRVQANVIFFEVGDKDQAAKSLAKALKSRWKKMNFPEEYTSKRYGEKLQELIETM